MFRENIPKVANLGIVELQTSSLSFRVAYVLENTRYVRIQAMATQKCRICLPQGSE